MNIQILVDMLKVILSKVNGAYLLSCSGLSLMLRPFFWMIVVWLLAFLRTT